LPSLPFCVNLVVLSSLSSCCFVSPLFFIFHSYFFLLAVIFLSYAVLSLPLNDSLLSFFVSYFSFIRLPPITFIFLFISSHFTSCFLCEVSAISTQLTSGASPCLIIFHSLIRYET
jgi:hypothetical protein